MSVLLKRGQSVSITRTANGNAVHVPDVRCHAECRKTVNGLRRNHLTALADTFRP